MKYYLMKKRVKLWWDERAGIDGISGFLKSKQVPQHRHSIWYYTGSAILMFFLIQVITGFMLIFYYHPTLEGANQSVARIMTEIPLGWIFRSIHSWSASFMIAFVFIHLFGIMLTKAYRKPRELTWMTGVLLLVVSLFFGFTGYLLPWDSLSLSATKVGTDIPRSFPVLGSWVTRFLRGGEDITGDTISRFFSFHVSILPVLIILLLGFHIYLIQKHGISSPIAVETRKGKIKTIPFWPNFFYRESLFWLLLFGILVTVAIFLPPHLDVQADLMAPAPEGVKPEWYFLFLFQTLKIFPSRILSIPGDSLALFLIFLVAMLFFFLPVLDNKPADRKGRIISLIIFMGLVYSVIMTLWSLL